MKADLVIDQGQADGQPIHTVSLYILYHRCLDSLRHLVRGAWLTLVHELHFVLGGRFLHCEVGRIRWEWQVVLWLAGLGQRSQLQDMGVSDRLGMSPISRSWCFSTLLQSHR